MLVKLSVVGWKGAGTDEGWLRRRGRSRQQHTRTPDILVPMGVYRPSRREGGWGRVGTLAASSGGRAHDSSIDPKASEEEHGCSTTYPPKTEDGTGTLKPGGVSSSDYAA